MLLDSGSRQYRYGLLRIDALEFRRSPISPVQAFHTGVL